MFYKLSKYIKEHTLKKQLVDISSVLNTKGVRVLCVDLPRKDRISNLSEFERTRIYEWKFDFNNIRNDDRIRQIYPNMSIEDIDSLFQGVVVYHNGSHKALRDYYSKDVNIIGGIRKTTDQPIKFSHTIYTVGACTIRGTGVEDENTVASILQRRLNKEYPSSYRVVNLGIGFGSSVNDDISILKELDFESGDIVIWGIYSIFSDLGEGTIRRIGFSYCDSNKYIENRNQTTSWFTDNTLHTNQYGNQIIAESVFDGLKESFNLKQGDGEKENGLILQGTSVDPSSFAFQQYIDYITKFRCPVNHNERNGCVVMNCNPFTNGHKYLVEYASKQVKKLYVFVVEEDKSFFSYEDRKKMVELGTQHLTNVTVLGSGRFIISALTFPGYFIKDNIKEFTVDCSNDVLLFAKNIAPLLDISVRYVGNEPLDNVTSHYNEVMSEILPKYGIELRIVERLKNGNNIVSASLVRDLMREARYNEIKEIVPQTTYDYIVDHFTNDKHS